MIDQTTRKLISLLTERVIAFPPAFARITNSHTAAILLAQIKYWCSKKERFYKTNDEFCAELFMGINEFKAAKKRLVDLGFITTEIRGVPATTYYSYNEEKVHEALLKTAETLDKSPSPVRCLEPSQPVGWKSTNQTVENQPTTYIDYLHRNTPLCVPPQEGQHQLQKNERENEERRTEVIENQPDDQFNIISITEDEGRTAESEKQDSNLVRFSENAKLTNEFHNAALSAGIHSTWIKDVFAKFREFWSKKQTVKSEDGWHQTWQSWCEKEFDSKRIPKRLCNESKPFLEDTEHLQAQEPVVNTDDRDERISNVKKRMLKNIGAFEYRNWIENLRFEIQGNSLKVYANTQFVADWVKRVYATTIKACSTFDSVEVIFALEQQVQQQQQAGQAYYAIDADPRIRDMRQKICNRLGAAFYRSNIERAKIEVTGNFMKIYVKNKHCVSYIERRLPSIYAALETEIGHIEVGIDSDRMGWKGVA